MSQLYNRDFFITVAGVGIDTRLEDKNGDGTKPTSMLRVSFELEKTGSATPNEAKLRIWNLSPTTRALFTDKEAKLPTVIEGGYTGDRKVLFNGNVSFVESGRQGTDYVTEFHLGDGKVAYQSEFINESFAPGTPIRDVLIKCVQATKQGVGNAIQKINAEPDLGKAINGLSLHGRASDVMEKCFASFGFNVSIQNGAYQVLKPNETTQETAVSLGQNSGLIGVPEKGERGVIKARALLNGALVPDRAVQLNTVAFTGLTKILKVKHIGDTWGKEWYSEIEVIPL